jgi:hypothetical protein
MKVEINKAQEICEVVRKNFPYESPWKQYKIGYRNILRNSIGKNISRDIIELNKKISENKRNLDFMRDSYQFFVEKPIVYFEEMVKAIQKYKSQNCGETARLGYLVSRINGVKNSNVTLGSLTARTIYSEKEEEFMLPEIERIFGALFKMEYNSDLSLMDHVVTKIQGNRKETFVIDPLLNETGNIRNMEQTYKTKYCDILDIEEYEAVKIIDYPGYPYPVMPTISDEEARLLGQKFQFLVLEENKDKINGARKHFFGLLEK